MAELYLTGKTEDGKRLVLAPISSTKLSRCAEPPEDTSGYFLTEEIDTDPLGAIHIIARVNDNDAAARLAHLCQLS